MKYCGFLTGFFLFMVLNASAQFIVRSQSRFETMPYTMNSEIKQPNFKYRLEFEQRIYWRTMFNEKDQEKSVYHFHSVYKRDSMMGAVIYGIEIDMLGAAFKKISANQFRYWNKFRLGMALLAEVNPDHEAYSNAESYNYLDAEIYLSFLHIPPKSRGDQTTKSRRGSFMLFALMTPSLRQDIFLKFKPIGSTWVKLSYYKEYGMVWMGGGVEVEVNPNGYDNSFTHSSKDIYRGLTVIGGVQMNMSNQQPSLKLGLKWDMCNH